MSLEIFKNLRKRLDDVFHPDTAAPGTPPNVIQSAGHCAVVAVIIKQFCGGTFRSTMVGDISHWYNRVDDGDPNKYLDVDLTADQFGMAPVRIGKDLYPNSKERKSSEVNEETRDRAELLLKRLGFSLGRFNERD